MAGLMNPAADFNASAEAVGVAYLEKRHGAELPDWASVEEVSSKGPGSLKLLLMPEDPLG